MILKIKLLIFLVLISGSSHALNLPKEVLQGSLVIGQDNKVDQIIKDGVSVKLSKEGYYVFAVGRDRADPISVTKILNNDPRYDISFFFKCNLNTAACRRWMDLKTLNRHITLGEVKKSLKKRNELDVKRRFSPLIQTKDSIIIRTDILNKKAMVNKMSKEIEKKLLVKYGGNYKTK